MHVSKSVCKAQCRIPLLQNPCFGDTSQEMNYGRRFPVAFTWVQATTDGGSTTLLLTGGKLLGNLWFLAALPDKWTDIAWDPWG